MFSEGMEIFFKEEYEVFLRNIKCFFEDKYWGMVPEIKVPRSNR